MRVDILLLALAAAALASSPPSNCLPGTTMSDVGYFFGKTSTDQVSWVLKTNGMCMYVNLGTTAYNYKVRCRGSRMYIEKYAATDTSCTGTADITPTDGKDIGRSTSTEVQNLLFPEKTTDKVYGQCSAATMYELLTSSSKFTTDPVAYVVTRGSCPSTHAQSNAPALAYYFVNDETEVYTHQGGTVRVDNTTHVCSSNLIGVACSTLPYDATTCFEPTQAKAEAWTRVDDIVLLDDVTYTCQHSNPEYVDPWFPPSENEARIPQWAMQGTLTVLPFMVPFAAWLMGKKSKSGDSPA